MSKDFDPDTSQDPRDVAAEAAAERITDRQWRDYVEMVEADAFHPDSETDEPDSSNWVEYDSSSRRHSRRRTAALIALVVLDDFDI